MKSSLFVSFSSLFFLSWLALSYTTSLKPAPRMGKGSLPISSDSPVKPSETEKGSLEKEVAISR
jgi:hypothetical protein